MIIMINSQWEGSSHWDSLGMFQIYYVRHQEINSTAMPVRIIDQKIRLHEPIVTNKLKLTVVKSAKPMVFKIQLLGMPADKKYQADPMLDKKTFHNCKLHIVWKLEVSIASHLFPARSGWDVVPGSQNLSRREFKSTFAKSIWITFKHNKITENSSKIFPLRNI